MPRFPLAMIVCLLATTMAARAQTRAQDSTFVRQHYIKLDRQIPMRDGVKLYTTIYVPKDASAAKPYPFLMTRTPYSAGPYGENNYRTHGPGPSRELSEEQYIFVYQDVRGRYLSEGQFEEMTPALRAGQAGATGPTAPHDESTDTFDTIEWLLQHVPGNNGRVGMLGISYPGFYASAALPAAHPALKAVSPQAPVTDEFIGDDARHKGAFFLLDNFEFTNYFDVPRPQPVADYQELFKFEPKDLYTFFLKLGPIKNANGPAYFNNRARIWNEYMQHETYDAYWQARNIRPALKGVKPAVLVVGGWFDAEDLYGALNTYKAIEKQNPGATNRLVMGPWTHGAWARPEWSKFGPLSFGSNTAQTFRLALETPFFNFYLKDKGSFNPAEATVFDTGTNQWKSHSAWPPAATKTRVLYLLDGSKLAVINPKASEALKGSIKNLGVKSAKVKTPKLYTQYLSDPANPVPYTDGVHAERNNEYMIEDQRFAAKRPDVLTFRTETLPNDFTVAGPITADLWVSTSGTDADFIVKVIDELPDGTQRLVRAEVMRGRFRNSFSKPEAFVPNMPTKVTYELPDVLHTFKQGHRLMVQVQSSWFPLVDRNPQTFVPIATAEEKDFQKATIRLYHDAQHPSAIRVLVLTP
ncbi:CocE/NonD family hydrolase [Hymenobacter rubidus]|uniref:CocE/NonD family hydrolase n=1 Tax=Hymenobacter rubidus TaxID=1441626 RepID=UPI00191F949F|nr:CocE/NonD family hydrolase [Hymenobacter rubidus]